MCEKKRESVYTEEIQIQTQIRSPFIRKSVIVTLQLVSEVGLINEFSDDLITDIFLYTRKLICPFCQNHSWL
jgi:hypothetical protein